MNKSVITGIVLILVVLIGSYFIFFNSSNLEQNPESNTDNNGDNLPSGVIEDNPNNNVNDSGNTDSTSPKTVEVLIQGYAFNPKTIEINVGDTVIWTNKDNIGHTVTSDSGNELNSPLFTKEKTYEHTFTMVETYNYHCKPHPYMKGTVIVN